MGDQSLFFILKLKSAETALYNLQNAKTLLQQAKANTKKAEDLLAQKQDMLNRHKQALNSDRIALENAKIDAEAAHKNLAKAQANYDSAKAAYDDAVAHLISDAQQYGDSVKVDQDSYTIKEGDALPDLKLANSFAKHRENSEITNMFMNLAAMPGDTLPEGTTISWKDAARAQRDAQHTGDYVEDVLITFPDGSTITKQVTLHVTYNPELHKTSSEVTGLPTGAKIVNGQVVDANGHVLPGYTVVNGQIVKTNSGVNSSAVAGSMTNTSLKRSNLNNGQLPQTSDANQAGLVGLGVASMLGMLGLAGIRRKQN